MGIVEETLAKRMLDGAEWRIEWNEGGWIHVHIGSIRFVLPEDKYRKFASLVLEARQKLAEMKGLPVSA